MGVAKYSPTVGMAYGRDHEWHEKLCAEGEWHDDEGYDSYGYHKDTKKDRAGFTEDDYISTAGWEGEEYRYRLYDDTYDAWGFNGIRPVLKG